MERQSNGRLSKTTEILLSFKIANTVSFRISVEKCRKKRLESIRSLSLFSV
ncbi:hypothetical protein CKA32_003573 [Geitlerinema sp. FC II]|nr:hypothetical protein CKA32_003573 [Geitlerinema sp. FC II]